MSKGVQIAIAMLSVFAALAWVISTDEGTFRYYASVSEYLDSERDDAASRVHGFVLDGSIQKDLPAGHVDFVIRGTDQSTLPVRYQGIDVPDLFADGAEVVVEGRFAGGRFLADRVMAKCPSKYESAGTEV